MNQKRTIRDVDGEDDVEKEAVARSAPRPRVEKALDQPKKLFLPSKDSKLRSVNFQKPFQLISFSYTPERELVFDDSALRFWVEPPRNADLSHGYSRWIKRSEERGRLDGLLKALCEKPCLEARERAAAVLWRGIMCKILVAPYETRDPWTLNVMLVGDTLYFEEHVTSAQLEEKELKDPKQRLQTYYGYAFESWCTSTRPRLPGKPAEWGGDVDTNVQWCSVVKGKLGDSRLLLGGEVDCVRDRYTGQPDTFMELKTSMTIRRNNTSDEARFEKKLLKFYFQSFLLGVPEIVVGFRSPRGEIQTLQSFKTLEIPRLIRGKPNAWDPSACLAWGDTFLTQVRGWMKNLVAGDDEKRRVCRLLFTPNEGVGFRELDQDEIEEVRNGEDRVGFLPTWYLDSLRSSEETQKSE